MREFNPEQRVSCAVTLSGNVSRKYPAKLPRHNEITGNDREE